MSKPDLKSWGFECRQQGALGVPSVTIWIHAETRDEAWHKFNKKHAEQYEPLRFHGEFNRNPETGEIDWVPPEFRRYYNEREKL